MIMVAFDWFAVEVGCGGYGGLVVRAAFDFSCLFDLL